MLLWTRRFLPKLVGVLWLFVSWYWLLGAPTTLGALLNSIDKPAVRLSEIDALAWIGLLFLAMWLVDRAFIAVATRIWGVDPYSVPWWRLRTEDGSIVCPRCRGTFFLPPASLKPDDPVTCDHCGRTVTTLADYRRHA